MNRVSAYIKLLRLPGLGGLAIPPVFGAISVGVSDPSSLAILFSIGCFAAIFGFVLNDYADVELDRLVKELHGKPLVSGAIERKHAVAICILCVILAYLCAFLLWRNALFGELQLAAIVVLSLAGILGVIYNMYGKHIPGSDFFMALSMSLVFLFGALAFGTPTLLTWVIFLLTFNQTLHMNAVEGGIKDADHDHLMGVKNIALTAGVRVEGRNVIIPWHFKAFGMGIRTFSVILVFIPFAYGLEYHIWQLALLLLCIVMVMLIEVKLIFLTQFDRETLRKLIAAAAFTRYAIVPIMLISHVGMSAFLLVVLPLLWYVAFTPLAGIKPFRPEM